MFIKVAKEKIIIFIILLFLCCIPIFQYSFFNQNHFSNNPNEISDEAENDSSKNDNVQNIIIKEEKQKTIYDVYSRKEINLLLGVVEAETEGCEFDVKCNVVSVIFNRVKSPKFKQNTITDVLLAPNQFSVVKSGKYKTIEVTKDTIDAVEYVFKYGDTAANAIFFETMKSNVHNSYATYIFNDGKHKFYN